MFTQEDIDGLKNVTVDKGQAMLGTLVTVFYSTVLTISKYIFKHN